MEMTAYIACHNPCEKQIPQRINLALITLHSRHGQKNRRVLCLAPPVSNTCVLWNAVCKLKSVCNVWIWGSLFSQQLKYGSHVAIQSIKINNAKYNYVVLHARSRVTVWVKFQDLEREYSRLLV